MKFSGLNPFVRSASLYERIGNSEECIGYESRIIYIVSGDILATVDGERLGHLSPGHLLFIPAGVPYKLKSKYVRAAVISFDLTSEIPEPTEKLRSVAVADFREELCHKVGLVEPFDKFIHIKDIESERETFLRMCELYTSAEGEYRAVVSAELKLVLLRIVETVDENALPAMMVESLDRYIRENCGEEISNTEIGAIFGYHPFYVSKMLKDRRGLTLRQYITAYRLKAAKRMLELTDKSTAEIAADVGFTDASYFAKTFKAAFGITPKEYRNGFKDDFV